MKPTTHIIPLTTDERVFVSALLAAAIERAGADRHLPGAGSVIANWPALADGMFEIVLPDEQRKAVYDLFGTDSLEELGVRGLRRTRRRPAGAQIEIWPDLPLREFAEVDPDDSPDGAICRGVTTRTPAGDLRNMFGDYVFDSHATLAVLTKAAADFCGNSRQRYRPKAPIKTAIERGWFSAYDSAEACDEVVRVWIEEVAAASLCKLRVVPPKSKNRYARVYIEWHHSLWKPPEARRPPLPEPPEELDASDQEALADLGAL